MREPTRNRFAFEQVGIVITINQKALLGFDDVDEQIEIDRRFGVRVDIDSQVSEV